MFRAWSSIAGRRLVRPYNVVLALALVVVVLVLAGALGIANALSEQRSRSEARAIEGPNGIVAASQRIRVADREFTLVGVWDRQEAATKLDVPLDRVPAAGETFLSDSLWALVQRGDRVAGLVEARLPGVIKRGLAPGLLLGPDELVAYSGAALDSAPTHAIAAEDTSAGARVGLALMTVLLLLPAASMVFMAARFDGRRRAQVLLDLRLLGASARHLKLLAVIEATAVAAASAGVGCLAWLAARVPLAASGIVGMRLFPEDLGLSLWNVVAVLSAVVAVSALASLTAVSGVLTATSGSEDERPAGAAGFSPRKAFLAILGGLVILHSAVSVGERLSDALLGLFEISGLTLACIGIVGLGPFLLGAVGRVLADRRASSVAALLGGRRLQFEPRESFRSAAGVVVMAFVFGGFAALDLDSPERIAAGRHDDDPLQMVELNGHHGSALVGRLRSQGLDPTPLAYRRVEHMSLVALATCDDLVSGLAAEFSSPCVPGSAYRTPMAEHRALASTVSLGEEVPTIGQEAVVVGEIRIDRHPTLLGGIDLFLPVEPAKLEAIEPSRVTVVVEDEAERAALLATVAEVAPLAVVGTFADLTQPGPEVDQVGAIARSALLGAFLLAGAALALAAADGALRRRESAALLFAVGMSRARRVQMVVAEVGLPLLVAVVPALLLGFEMVYVGGSIIGGDVRLPVGDLLMAVAAVGVVVALAVLVTMSFVARLPTTAILQAER